jgi:hypothetical protein
LQRLQGGRPVFASCSSVSSSYRSAGSYRCPRVTLHSLVAGSSSGRCLPKKKHGFKRSSVVVVVVVVVAGAYRRRSTASSGLRWSGSWSLPVPSHYGLSSLTVLPVSSHYGLSSLTALPVSFTLIRCLRTTAFRRFVAATAVIVSCGGLLPWAALLCPSSGVVLFLRWSVPLPTI